MGAFLAVAAGGAIGASLRYAVVLVAARVLGTGFPFGTMTVNVLGSFIMGVAAVALAPRLGPFLMVGLLGGFTTFSSFSLDVFKLWDADRLGAAVLYVGGSVTLSIAALFAGLYAGRALLT